MPAPSHPTPVSRVLPVEADLPGGGWLAIDEGFSAGPGVGGPGEVLDCVGPGFPDGDEIDATAATPHYLRPPGRLLHGFGLSARDEATAKRAETVLAGEAFAACLGRAVAADLEADRLADAGAAELLAVDVDASELGHRARFVGGTGAGIRPVFLDVVCLRIGTAVGLLWFADTPDPFAPEAVAAVVDRIRDREPPSLGP